MPGPSILRINDIFWSFQGEGARFGMPSIFVRLQGCSLHCSFCDTKESWPSKNETPLSEIIAQVEHYGTQYPDSQVVITGGEPLEQDISRLVESLKEKDFFVSIETNGKRFQPVPIDWWTVSPKEAAGYELNPDLAPHVCELKLVVTPGLTIETVQHLRCQVPGAPIFLQPEGFDPQRYQHTFALFRRCREAGIENLRCGIQMHKVYNVK
jgi:organic radical activating enzyme